MSRGVQRTESEAEYFQSHYVVEPSGCWRWIGSTAIHGYAYMSDGHGGKIQAYRIAYELYHGTIEPGYHIHHTCHNRACVNPMHLEMLPARVHLQLTADERFPIDGFICHRGHTYTKANTYYERNGGRRCRECMRIKRRAAYERRQQRRRKQQEG